MNLILNLLIIYTKEATIDLHFKDINIYFNFIGVNNSKYCLVLSNLNSNSSSIIINTLNLTIIKTKPCIIAFVCHHKIKLVFTNLNK